MQAVSHSRFGPPEEVLELVDEPLPAPGANEVSIRVEATPIHTGDLHNIAGDKTMLRTVTRGEQPEVELPQIPGIDGIGRITAVGESVTDFTPGQRVYLPIQCGSWRDEINADAAAIFQAPEGDPVQLSLIINALTADCALQDLADPEHWFLQNSANSNVGRILIVLAKRRGYRTVNIVRRESLVDELKALGADIVLLDSPDIADRVHAATDGAPIPVGLDGIGGDATGRLAECVSDRGTVLNMGLMSGKDVTIPNWLLLYKQVSITGFYAGYNLSERGMDERRNMVAELSGLISEGVLQAKIAATYKLSEFREAVMHAQRAGSARDGKIVFDLTQ